MIQLTIALFGFGFNLEFGRTAPPAGELLEGRSPDPVESWGYDLDPDPADAQLGFH